MPPKIRTAFKNTPSIYIILQVYIKHNIFCGFVEYFVAHYVNTWYNIKEYGFKLEIFFKYFGKVY